MLYTILNIVFVQSRIHMVLMSLAGIGLAYLLLEGCLYMGHPPEYPWSLYYFRQLGISSAIWCCFFIPPFIVDQGRIRSHVISGLAAPMIALGIYFACLLAIYMKEIYKKSKISEQLMEQLKKREIPEKFPSFEYNGISKHQHKNIRKIGSPYPVAYNWVRELKPLLNGKKCLEISCGLGMLSKAMLDVGIDVIPTEKKVYSSGKNPDWCNIERCTAVEAVEKYGKETDYIICIWPDPDDPDIGNALKEMHKINPKCKLILVGCSCAGICGCENNSAGFEENEYIDGANKATSWWAAQILYVDIGKYLEPQTKRQYC